MANGPVNNQTTADSDGQRSPVKPGPNSGQGVIDLDKEADETLRQHREAEVAKRTALPVTQAPGQINWLGSSYTGQDIKVVAHLYDTAQSDLDSKKKELEEQREYLDALVKGATALTAGQVFENIVAIGDTFDKRKDMLEATLGFGSTPAEDKAKAYLFNIVLYNPDVNFFLGFARAREALNNLKNSAKKESEDIGRRIEQISKLDTASSSTLTLGTLQTLSVQSVREKYAVRALGHAYAKAYTRGTRTLAGSMIFTLFEEHPLSKLLRAMGESKRWNSPEISRLLPDQIPPIDITIIFANEYGALSHQKLYGVEFVNDSTTYSIENLLSEQILQFTCRDIDVLTSNGMKKLSDSQMFGQENPFTGSQLYSDDEYHEYLETLGLRRRLSNR